MVGNSGAAGERLNEVTASARSFPSRTRGKASGMGLNIIVTRPPMQVRNRGGHALVGDVPDIDARRGLEQLRGQVVPAAAAAGGVT